MHNGEQKRGFLTMKHWRLLACLLLGIAVIGCGWSFSLLAQGSERGTLDFSGHTGEFETKLNGEWLVFEQELLQPDEVVERLEQGKGRTVSLPASFAEHMGIHNTYATYAARIRLPAEMVGVRLAIHIPFQYSAYRLYVDNQVLMSNGVVGTDADTHISEMSGRSRYFTPASDTVLLTVQVSSFLHIRGGLENSITLGEAKQVMQRLNSQSALDMFMYGVILITGVLMILIALFVRRDKPMLYFGFFCLLFFIRSFYAVPFYYNQIFLKTTWLWGTRLEYFFTEAVMMMYILLVAEWYRSRFSWIVSRISAALLVGLMTVTWFTQPVFFQTLFFNISYLAIPVFFYFLFVLIKEIHNKHPAARWNILGLLIIFVAHLHDYAIGRAWISSSPVMLQAVFLFVLTHVIVLSRGYAGKIRETVRLNEQLQQLNDSLDRQVHERTRELQQMNEKLSYLASRDSLTEIHNRHSFNAFITEAFSEAAEQRSDLSVIMLDLDEFKKYNDTYGHLAGDALLARVSRIIETVLPDDSFFARYGGEEFVVVLPMCGYGQAERVAAAIRQALEQAAIEHRGSALGLVTISSGAATLTAKREFATEFELIDAADQRLYSAKRSLAKPYVAEESAGQ